MLAQLAAKAPAKVLSRVFDPINTAESAANSSSLGAETTEEESAHSSSTPMAKPMDDRDTLQGGSASAPFFGNYLQLARVKVCSRFLWYDRIP